MADRLIDSYSGPRKQSLCLLNLMGETIQKLQELNYKARDSNTRTYGDCARGVKETLTNKADEK